MQRRKDAEIKAEKEKAAIQKAIDKKIADEERETRTTARMISGLPGGDKERWLAENPDWITDVLDERVARLKGRTDAPAGMQVPEDGGELQPDVGVEQLGVSRPPVDGQQMMGVADGGYTQPAQQPDVAPPGLGDALKAQEDLPETKKEKAERTKLFLQDEANKSGRSPALSKQISASIALDKSLDNGRI
jgi:hypothetical protein